MDWLVYFKVLGIVFLILAGIQIFVYFYKKVRVKNIPEGKKIKILEIKPITYKAQILLIEVQGKKFLIGLTDKGFTKIGEFDEERS